MSSAPTARACALDVLDTVLGDRRPLDDALADHAGLARLEARDRAFARLLVSTTLRRLGQIDALIAHCLDKPLSAKAARIRQILRLGTCQLAFLGTPPHAAVDGAVSLVGRNRAYKGLVNAVLRRLAREGAGLAAKHDAPRLDTPGWLWESWRRAYGEATARAIAEAHLAEPPLDITVKRDAEGWARRLDARVLPTGTLRRALGGAVADLDGYAEGGWWVQDAAASLPARLLGDVAGETVIELCAAPGGKTAQLAAAGAHVVAVDRSARRLDSLRQNLARRGPAAETIAADALDWRPRAPARFVLLDAPCSATGAIRRRPDIPHLKTAADVARLAALQDRLLDAAYPMLAPGGTLVWSVCSLEPEEGPERIAALLERAPGLERVAITAGEIGGLSELVTAAGDLRTLPCHLADRGGLDGFFVARLRRTG